MTPKQCRRGDRHSCKDGSNDDDFRRQSDKSEGAAGGDRIIGDDKHLVQLVAAMPVEEERRRGTSLVDQP